MTTHSIPSHAEISALAEGLRPAVAACAAESEERRSLSPQAVALMADAGLWRMLTPRGYGGWEAGLRAQVDTVMTLSDAYPAAGWVLMVTNAHSFVAGNFPPECQDEVFGASPDVRIPGTLGAQGTAVREDGGWRVSGRWQFASGIDHGDWVILGARADNLPESPIRAIHVIVPKRDLIVEDTWYTLGLRGTGSKDLVARDVWVPAHRSLPTAQLLDGSSPHGERHATHLYRQPMMACLSVQLGGAAVGIATGALRLCVERTRDRTDMSGRPRAESPATQLRIAESAVELRTAQLLVRDAADACERTVSRGDWLTVEERAARRWDAAYAVALCRRAVERVYAADGAHGVYDENLLQRYYRDINTASHHAIADFDGNGATFGRVALGLGPGNGFL